jgi:hypothetical protein
MLWNVIGNRGSQGMWFNVEQTRHKEMLAQVKNDVLKVSKIYYIQLVE